MIINELKQHGTEDFPFQLYKLNAHQPKYVMSFHWHSSIELIRVLEGKLSLTVDNRKHTLIKGDVAIINSECVHGAMPEDCYYECVVFDPAFFKTGNGVCDEFTDDLLSGGISLNERPESKEVVSIINKLFDELGQTTEGIFFKVLGFTLELYGEIKRRREYEQNLSISSVKDEKKVVKLKTALKFIRENYAKQITLEDIAEAAELSCKYFCKFFKQMTGSTPINYLMSYRIERAARKLLTTDISVTKICYDCGFNDLSYFIKTFKAFKGVSPKEYRNTDAI